MNVGDCGKIEKNSCLNLGLNPHHLGEAKNNEFSPKALPLSYGSIL
jgi:hypothetical protein